MENNAIQTDKDLGARLTALRQLYLRLDADTGEPVWVHMPDESTARADMRPGGGLRASGMLLCYALLGEFRTDAREAVASALESDMDRTLRRVCDFALKMTGDQSGFDQAALYAALRTASVIMPEGGVCGALPGVMRSAPEPVKKVEAPVLTARFAWAGDAAIAYIDLPEGAESATIADREYSRAECHAGVCLPAGRRELAILVAGAPSTLRVEDPLAGLRFRLGFRLFGKIFIAARRLPRVLKSRLKPVIRVSGGEGEVPALKVITSAGELSEQPKQLLRGRAWLMCPPVNWRTENCVKLTGAGTRYLEISGEG